MSESPWGPGLFENDTAVMVLEALVDLTHPSGQPVYQVDPAAVEEVVIVHEIPATLEAIEALAERPGWMDMDSTAGLMALSQVLVNAGATNHYPLIRDAALRAIELRTLRVIEMYDDCNPEEAFERFEAEQALGMQIKAVTPLLRVVEFEVSDV